MIDTDIEYRYQPPAPFLCLVCRVGQHELCPRGRLPHVTCDCDNIRHTDTSKP